MERSKEERKQQVKPIFEKLTELELYVHQHPPIKELFKIIQDYITNGESQKINILIPSINRRIKGKLEINKTRESVIRLICV